MTITANVFLLVTRVNPFAVENQTCSFRVPAIHLPCSQSHKAQTELYLPASERRSSQHRCCVTSVVASKLEKIC